MQTEQGQALADEFSVPYFECSAKTNTNVQEMFLALATMAGEGDTHPLVDGQGRVWGHYRITRMEEEQRAIMAGGAPRQVGFRIDLERGDDKVEGPAA